MEQHASQARIAHQADIASIFACLQQVAITLQGLLASEEEGYLESQNASGDIQLGVDVRADILIQEALLHLACVRGVCSEEKPKALYKIDASSNDASAPYTLIESSSLIAPDGGLLIAYDPLDGSSLFDSNLSVGSIFGIYDGGFQATQLIASIYIVYGPRLEAVLASNDVRCYVYDASLQTWRDKGTLMLNNQGKLNAPGGTQQHWSKEHKAFIDGLFERGYRLRYSGGMVPDLHQILCKGGGLFSYPATPQAPQGKLRKLFEVFPFALVYELAGGEGIDGRERLLSLKCQSLHESAPCFLGSKEEIALVKAYMNK